MASGTELAKAYVQIIPSANGIRGSIEDVLCGEADSAGTKAGNSIASKIKAVIAAAGIGKALSMAINEGAALEQSIGGIETLFKESADTMKAYAAEAYRTAGISANSYMEQSTSFAASLLQSLGGDTAKAAEAANQAIIDMADNSNKMGTSLELIQNAYQGFAKQNYTMLDNLKLGYGGTKEEMQRLLADAQELSGVEYDISNLADVYSAIHVIQENLDITGTTAKEAATTLSGSFASMKASAQNFLGNLTLGKDIQPSLNALVETTSTYLFDNLLPAIGNIIMALPGAIGTFITSAMPLLHEQGLNFIQSISSGIASGIPNVLSNVLPMIMQFTAEMRANFGEIVDAGMELLLNVAQGIANAMPDLIAYVPTIVSNIAGCINDNFPKILETAFNIIVTLVKGLIDAIPVIIDNMPQIISAIWDTLTAINWLNLGSTIINGIGKGIGSVGSSIKEKIVEIGKKAWESFKNINWRQLGKDIINGIKNGITGAVGGLVNSVKDAASNAFNSVKNFFGIASPSKLMEQEIGKWIPLGMAVGIDDEAGAVSNALEEMNKGAMASLDTSVDLSSGFSSSGDSFDVGRLLEGLIIEIDNSVTVGDRMIREDIASYTIKKIGNRYKAVLATKGG